MSHTPHEISDEFPAETAKIQGLKGSDAHFAKMLDDYHDVNRQLHRVETRVEPTSTEHEAILRKSRARLKDLIWKALQVA